jgi:hypothetical protein
MKVMFTRTGYRAIMWREQQEELCRRIESCHSTRFEGSGLRRFPRPPLLGRHLEWQVILQPRRNPLEQFTVSVWDAKVDPQTGTVIKY